MLASWSRQGAVRRVQRESQKAPGLEINEVSE